MSPWGESLKAVETVKGLVVESVVVSEDKRTIDVTFTDGTLLRGTSYGDCCSHTWIEHMTVPVDVAGATLTEVVDSAGLDPHEPVEEDTYELIQVYHTSIKTSRGEIIIEYRNSSNGYYGGSLDWSLGVA